jgi:hypothetical protein
LPSPFLNNKEELGSSIWSPLFYQVNQKFNNYPKCTSNNIKFTIFFVGECTNGHANCMISLWEIMYVATSTRKKRPKCTPYICNYMQLFVIYNYFWLFVQLFTNFGHTCNYVAIIFFFVLLYGQHLITFSFKNNYVWPISCNNDQN